MSEKVAENQLLILAARPSLTETAVRRLRSAVLEITNWQYVIEMAQEHCVLSLLYRHLCSEAADETPPDVMSQLRDLNQANASYAFCLTAELIELLELFKEHGVDAVSFKGPTLSLSAFGDVAARQFADLDLLVAKQHVSRARSLLAGRGFLSAPRLAAGQEAALLRLDCAQNFRNQQNVNVDLHWKIAAKYLGIDIDLNGFRHALQPVHIGQKMIMTLSQEDLLLVLSVHCFTHNWERLGWISDIAGLVDRKATDWDLLLRNAARLGLTRIVSVSLFLASELLEAQIPSTTRSQIEGDAAAVELGHQYVENILTPRGSRPSELMLTHLRMRERLYDRIYSGFRWLVTPCSFDWLSVSMPAPLWFLYYLVRPVRHAWKHAKQFARSQQQPQRLHQPIKSLDRS